MEELATMDLSKDRTLKKKEEEELSAAVAQSPTAHEILSSIHGGGSGYLNYYEIL